MHSPTDASPPSLRTATHGLGPIGSLLLHRIGLAPTAHCRSPGALRKILDTTILTDAARKRTERIEELETQLAQLERQVAYLKQELIGRARSDHAGYAKQIAELEQ